MSWRDGYDELVDVSSVSSRGCVNVATLYPKKGTPLKEYPDLWYTITLLCSSLMCFNGGFINGVSFSGPWSSGLTHVTGSVTLSATRVTGSDHMHFAFWQYMSFVAAFCVGSAVTGFIIGEPWARWGRIQASLLIAQGLLITLAIYLSTLDSKEVFLSSCCISFAMGIQNTITSMFSPMTLRTSHFTGTVVDIGATIGQMIRHRDFRDSWKIKVNTAALICFWVGALCGGYTYTQIHQKALYVNVAITLTIGVVTFILFRSPICSFMHEQPTLSPNNNNNNNNHFKTPVANEFYNNSTEKELTDTTLFQSDTPLFQSAYQNQGGNNEGHKVSYGSFQTSDDVFLDQGIGQPHHQQQHVILLDTNESQQLLPHENHNNNNNTLNPLGQNYHYQ